MSSEMCLCNTDSDMSSRSAAVLQHSRGNLKTRRAQLFKISRHHLEKS